ncbi:6393_t:CDS:2, partial [Racocetra persica]
SSNKETSMSDEIASMSSDNTSLQKNTNKPKKRANNPRKTQIKHIQNQAPVRDYLNELDDRSNECKVVVDQQSFLLSENAEFIKFLQELDLRYHLPCHQTLSTW